MSKKREQAAPRIDSAHAATTLNWRLGATGPECDALQATVAWIISTIPMSNTEQSVFLSALGLEKKPTPQGNFAIVYSKPPSDEEPPGDATVS